MTTREQLDALIAKRADILDGTKTEYVEFGDLMDQLHNWEHEIGQLAGSGTPSDEAKADELSTDYICALDDGSIVAWGAEHPIPGYQETYREIVVLEKYKVTATNLINGKEMGSVEVQAESKEAAVVAAQHELAWDFCTDEEGHFAFAAVKIE